MIYLDFETYSEVDLKSVGSWVYSTHESTEILCMAYAIDDESVQLWLPDKPFPEDLKLALLEHNVEAHNVFFEKCIWHNVGVCKYKFPKVNFQFWQCSAAKVATHALPRSLKEAAKVLELKNQKDTEGSRVMLKLTSPKLPTKTDPATRYDKKKYSELYKMMYEYCKQDVETERELSKYIRDLHPFEREIFILDQEINVRGIPIDIKTVKLASETLEYTKNKALERIKKITNGEIASFTQTVSCVKWANSQGYPMEAFNKEYLEQKLEDPNMPDKVRELIKLRQENGKTSTAKYATMLNCVSNDGRIRDNYMYHGASTGRWSGKNVQFQNIPRGKITDMGVAVKALETGNEQMIECLYGVKIVEFLSWLLRGMIKAEDGNELYVADYNAIEARGTAWLSGQTDLLKDFEKGEKIYEKQAAFTYGKKVEDIKEDSIERFVGKTLILACGYGMGAKKFQVTCASQKVNLDLEFCEAAVKSYREKNKMIVKQWYAQENAAMLAVRTGKPITESKVTWFIHGKFLYCKLPSGRCLAYYKPSIKMKETSWGDAKNQLHVWGEKQIETRKVFCEYSIYGGLIVENIVQAICRDIVAYGMLELNKKGFNIIMHSHDEVISENRIGFSTIENYENIMATVPEWAKGFPIKAKGWKGNRYKK